MFGYVRPLRCELKVKEDELFRAVYCGLCHTLKQEYGFLSRFILNYDFTFLAMLLIKEPVLCRKRCPASPLKAKKAALRDPGLSAAAAASVISTYWKLCDEVEDQKGLRRLGEKLLRNCFGRAYRKAREKLPEFARLTRSSILQLQTLEKERCSGIDAPADTFASSLSALSALAPEPEQRPLRELFYHIGRWIYLMDAADDLEEDLASGNYNPLILRYGIIAAPLPDEARQSLDLTARHSLNLAGAAWALLPPRPCGPILENTLTLSLPAIQSQVLSGTYRKTSKYTKEDRSFT